MYINILLIWIIVWVVFLIMSCIEKRGYLFGVLAGIWIMFLGVYIIVDGLHIQDGISIVINDAGEQIVTYTYENLITPFSSYSTMWGLPFVLLGIYIMYMATRNKGSE